MSRAAIYSLTDVEGDKSPSSLGTVIIADQIVATGSLSLSRQCYSAFSCVDTGPWGQVDFSGLWAPLANAIAGAGNGTVDHLSLGFDDVGAVARGAWEISADTFAGQPFGLQASGSGGATQIGTVAKGNLDPDPISITWTRNDPVGTPEPSTLGLLLAAVTILVWRLRRAAP